MDLIADLRAARPRPISDAATGVLEELMDRLNGSCLEAKLKTRGHFGTVLRWSRSGVPWFDALPANKWVLFYLTKYSLAQPGLDFASITLSLSHARERRDLVVNVRLHSKTEAEIMAGLVASALRR